MDKKDPQGWLDRLSKIRWDVVDFTDQLLGKKETEVGILQLVEAARTNTIDPQPQLDLAMAYVARVQTPPNWNEQDVKNALHAFRKARSISKKHTPLRTRPIEEHLVETMHGVASAYLSHYAADPDRKWLDQVVWLLENVLPEAKENTGQTAMVRATLRSCLLSSLDWHEKELASAPDREDLLRTYLSTADRAILYCNEDDPIRCAIGYDAAVMQLAVGCRFAELASQSHVLGGQDGRLLEIEDKEHKEYARKAIDLLCTGRKQLKQYPVDAELGAQMASADEALGVAYGVLYNLTWAHSKMSASIPILQEGVEALPDDASLWYALGNAYNALADEVIEDTNARINRSQRMGRLSKDAAFGAAVGSRIAVSGAKKSVNKYTELAEQCFLRARTLAPDAY